MRYFVRDLLIRSLSPEALINQLAERLGISKNSFRFQMLTAECEFVNGILEYFADFAVDTSEFIRDTTVSFSDDSIEPEIPARGAKGNVVVIGDELPGLYAALLLAKAGAKPIIISRSKGIGESIDASKKFGEKERQGKQSDVLFGGELLRQGGFVDRKSQSRYGKFVADDILSRIGKPNSFSRYNFINKHDVSVLLLSLSKEILDNGGSILFDCSSVKLKTFLGKAKMVDFTQSGKAMSIKADSVLACSRLPILGAPSQSGYFQLFVYSRMRDVDSRLYRGSRLKEPRYFACHDLPCGAVAYGPFPFSGSLPIIEESKSIYSSFSLLGESVLGYYGMPLYLKIPDSVGHRFAQIKQEVGQNSYRESIPGSLPCSLYADFMQGSPSYNLGLVRGDCPTGFHLADMPKLFPSGFALAKRALAELKERAPYAIADGSLVVGYGFVDDVPDCLLSDERGRTKTKGLSSCACSPTEDLDLAKTCSKGILSAYSALL